jgi:hypothetical protein
MKAIFNQQKHLDNAKNMNGEKELLQRIVVVDDAGSKQQIVDCRLYMGRSRNASAVYCSIWANGHINNEHVWISGHGKAGGHGYHKASAAMQNAITAAGFTLTDDNGDIVPIAGRGDDAMHDAVIAISAALGFNDVILIK